LRTRKLSTVCVSPNYIGIDGSKTPFADNFVDLVLTGLPPQPYSFATCWSTTTLGTDSIVRSTVFQNKLCLILFTPFAPETKEIGHDKGIDVPDLSFNRQDIELHFSGLKWTLIKDIQTKSHYGIEHVYLVWQP
jgi:hypothetical protein